MSLFLTRKKILKDIKTLVIKDGWNDQLFFNYSKISKFSKEEINALFPEGYKTLIDMYLEALKMQESSGNYQAQHTPEVITDIVTGKKIRVQAVGAYGILDINWNGTKTQKSWAEQAGYKGADWHDPAVQDAVARYKVQEYFNKYGSWDAVSVAWFAGAGNANELVNNGTINYDLADANGQTIKDYVNEMNNNRLETISTASHSEISEFNDSILGSSGKRRNNRKAKKIRKIIFY